MRHTKVCISPDKHSLRHTCISAKAVTNPRAKLARDITLGTWNALIGLHLPKPVALYAPLIVFAFNSCTASLPPLFLPCCIPSQECVFIRYSQPAHSGLALLSLTALHALSSACAHLEQMCWLVISCIQERQKALKLWICRFWTVRVVNIYFVSHMVRESMSSF